MRRESRCRETAGGSVVTARAVSLQEDGPMVNVTERAKAKLKELLQTEGEDQSVGLRLGTTASGELGVFPDRERDDDQIIKHHGVAVLLVGQEITEEMEDTTIDYDESGPEPGLVIRPSS
jgi:Fe-S cluster assembly iron-binding protein IscA